MLSEDTLERLTERLVDRVESLNTYFIKKIGNQIKTIGTITPSQLNELLQSVQYGNDINEIMNKIAEITDMNVKDIYKIFEEVAKKNQLFSKKFYDYKKIKFIPYEENKILQNQVMSIAKATANEYVNMSKTFAYMRKNASGIKEYTSLSEIYQKITDEAILSVAQGRESYQMAMQKAMREMTTNGLRIVDYSTGYSRRADSSVRMNIMDGIRRLNREVQEQFGKEFEADGIEVSHHKYAAPDHIDTIDGRQFSKNGEVIVDGIKYEDYNTINDSLVRHVGELNCYHFPFQIVLGVSKPLHTKEELEADKEENEKGFDFEDNHYTMYEGTQLQRQIETKIRQYKDRQIGAKAINDTDEVYHCQEKIRQLTDKYYDLHKVSGLPTKIDRLRVDGYRTISNKKVINNSENNNYIDITSEWLETATPNSHIVEDRQYFEYKGNRYNVDGKNVVLDYSSQEKNIAEWLENTFGGGIYMLPRINNPEGIQTADYLFRGEYWDLKSISGKSKQVIYHSIYKKKTQSNNFIFDVVSSELDINELQKQIYKLYNRKDTKFLQKIILKKENDIFVYKRK
mgnify:CR=1 FL=1